MHILATALNAFWSILKGRDHVFQSKKYTSIKCTNVTRKDMMSALYGKAYLADEESAKKYYWEDRILNNQSGSTYTVITTTITQPTDADS